MTFVWLDLKTDTYRSQFIFDRSQARTSDRSVEAGDMEDGLFPGSYSTSFQLRVTCLGMVLPTVQIGPLPSIIK